MFDAATDVHIYRIPNDQRARQARKAYLRSVVPMLLVPPTIWMVTALWARFDSTLYAPTLRSAIPQLVLVGLYALYGLRTARQLADIMLSYQLTLSPNVLRVTQLNKLPTELVRGQVRTIHESSLGLVLCYDGGLLGLSSDVAHYADARARLAQWAPIKRRPSLTAFWVVLALLVGNWSMAAFSVRAPALLPALLGLATFGVVAWLTSVVYRTRLDAKHKSNALFSFGLIALVVGVFAYRAVMHWVHA